MNSDHIKERGLVIAKVKRRFGAEVFFRILHPAIFDNVDQVSILFPAGSFVTIEPVQGAPWVAGKLLRARLDGFATATQAEKEGVYLAHAFLEAAVSLDIGLELRYTTALPAKIVDRTRGPGGQTIAYGVVGWGMEHFVREVLAAYAAGPLDRTLSLSMELFGASKLNPTEVTRFITLVSALEPLASQISLGDVVAQFVYETIDRLNSISELDPAISNSLGGRVKQLRQESVRQALFRLAATWFPGREDIREEIDSLYAIRSELLHSGATKDKDIDFHANIIRMESILRSIFQKMVRRPFHVLPTP